MLIYVPLPAEETPHSRFGKPYAVISVFPKAPTRSIALFSQMQAIYAYISAPSSTRTTTSVTAAIPMSWYPLPPPIYATARERWTNTGRASYPVKE